MIWKPKEKELTREDTIALAIKELEPFWFGIPPQIAGIKTSEGYAVLPLDPQFSKLSWLIFFIDPTDNSGQSAALFAKEWYRRYHLHGVEFLFSLVPTYKDWRTRNTVNDYREALQLQFPVSIDIDLNVTKAFGAKAPPMVLLLHNGHQYFTYSGDDWLKNAELNIQDFLRIKDPGLALSPVFTPAKTVILDTKRLEFGYSPILGTEAPFEKPGFVATANGYRTGRFHSASPKKLGPEEIFISGEWMQDAEKIATNDPNALISFMNSAMTISIIAQTLSKTPEIPLIVIEVDGDPAYESIAGDSLILDDSGQSILRVRQTQVYHILKNLPADKSQQVSLRFPNANHAPVALYGCRFGEIAK